MKIAFVTPAYYPATIGASLYCQELADGLIKLGHQVTVFVNSPMNYKKEEFIDGVIVKRFYPKIFGSYYVSEGMLKTLLKERFDIIHSHHYGYYPATAGFIAAKLSKTPHVFGPYYHPPIYGLKRQILSSVYHLTQGLPILKFSDKTLPHTEYEKKLLLKIGGNEENIDILPNIVDTNLFKPDRNIKKERIVLFASNLLFEKGAHIAFNLAEKMIKADKEIKFVFIGGPWEQKLIHRINKLKQNKNITFLYNLPKEKLIEWYNRASVFILPSKYEAFGRVIAEAEACETPVVTTEVGGIPEVVLNNKTGFLVKYGEWKAFEDRIKKLLFNETLTKTIGKSARRHIVRSFDKNVVVRKLVKIYENIC